MSYMSFPLCNFCSYIDFFFSADEFILLSKQFHIFFRDYGNNTMEISYKSSGSLVSLAVINLL